MIPWLVALACALIAIALFVLWRRAVAGQVEAQLGSAHAEETARESSRTAGRHAAQLQALKQAQLDAVLIVSADRTVLDLNPAARALFGPQAAPGQTLIVATRSAELDELAAHALAGGADCDRQVILGRMSQPYRARAVWAGAPEPGGVNAGVVLVLQDLRELQRLGRARRDFVANISHELRTPITSIRLLVDTLRGSAAADATARDDLLEKISAETETLAQLSQELLDLAQIESGQALVRLVPTSAAELVAGVTERLGPQAERKRQAVTLDVPSDLIVLADADQMNRALGNLLHNAIKFTPPEGKISVRAYRLEGDVVVEVADNGPGIPPEDLPRVFERFFRGDRARASGGTGLGLAIAKHVVEAHGGRIWVESHGRPGGGAIFRFTLPAGDSLP